MSLYADTQTLRAPISCTISAQESYADVIQQHIQAPFVVESVDFTTDVCMDNDEFVYLTDLKAGSTVDVPVLTRAISYLFKKNIFTEIVLTLTPGVTGYHLHCDLKGQWIFAALKLHGMMLGKDKCRQYYLLQAGEAFDESQHQLSVKKIKEALVEEGYWANCIHDELDYDYDTKSITVHLTISPGAIFKVGNVHLVVRMHEKEDEQLRDQLYKKFFKKIIDKPYNKVALNKEMNIIKRSLATEGFFHADIQLHEKADYETELVDLVLSVDLYEKKVVRFIGNHFFSYDQLLDELLLFGQSLWMLPPLIIQQEIEHFYAKKGFWQCKATVDEKPGIYECTIHEGPRSRITSVKLNNIQHADEAALVEEFFPAKTLKEHDKEIINRRIDDLVTWYVGKGYLDARVIKQECIPLDATNYELALTLHEGECSVIRKIIIEEFPALEQEELFVQCLTTENPVACTMELLQEQREWLLNYCVQQGYVHSKVTPDIERDGKFITLIWKVSIGQRRQLFGKTIIQGNSTLPFKKIMRELHYKQGTPWNQTQLKHTMLRFKKLEIFDSINLCATDDRSQDDEQPVILKLLHDDPFEVRFRAGFAAQQVDKSLHSAGLTYRIGGMFLMKNPFNQADQLRLQADSDKSQRAACIEYCIPWLHTVPVVTTVKGYSNRYQQPGLIGCKKNLYEIIQQGFLVNFLRNYGVIDAGVTCGFEVMETTLCEDDQCLARVLVRELARAINFEPRLLDQKIPYLQVEPTLIINNLDQPLQPYQGSFTLLSLKGMVPLNRVGSSTYFVRCTVEQSYFVPLYGMVLGLRLRIGHIFHRALRSIMPTERFYLGGANSVRSYETDRCPPLGAFVDESNCVQWVPQGGKTMLNGNIELRFPLRFVKNLGGVVFQDVGFLSGDRLFEWLERPLLAATGFGLRYITPLGPLRFDIAWKWHRWYKEELRYAWFISFGQAF